MNNKLPAWKVILKTIQYRKDLWLANWLAMMVTMLFYLVLTPIGLIAKVTGKNFLDTSFRKNQSSYWKEIPVSRIDKSSYEKQF